MANTPKKLYANKPGTASSTFYTVPASTTTIIKNILLCNTTGADATVSMLFGGVDAFNQSPVPAHSTVALDLTEVINAGETITGLQDTAGAISVIITGLEVA